MGLYERQYYREDGLSLQPNWDNRSAISYLLIINIAVFIANIVLTPGGFPKGGQGVVNQALLLNAADATNPIFWWHTLSYAFAHDATSIWHLVFNMAGLYFLGRSVEDLYGKWEFLRIYLLTAWICGVLWLAKHFLFGDRSGAVLGASGAVICIQMLFVLNFPKSTIYFFIFPMPAWVLGVLLVLMNLFASPTSNVAIDVHLTGIVCAVLYFFLGLNLTFLGDLKHRSRLMKRKWFGPKLQILNETGNSAKDDAEADRILQKIHDQGKDSLSSRERKFMENYSRKVRQRKQDLP